MTFGSCLKMEANSFVAPPATAAAVAVAAVAVAAVAAAIATPAAAAAAVAVATPAAVAAPSSFRLGAIHLGTDPEPNRNC